MVYSVRAPPLHNNWNKSLWHLKAWLAVNTDVSVCNSCSDLRCTSGCCSADFLWLQAGSQRGHHSEGCGRVFPGSGGRRWHCWPSAGSGCAAAGQRRLDKVHDQWKRRLNRVTWATSRDVPHQQHNHPHYLIRLHLPVQTSGRKRLSLDCGRSLHKPERTAGAPMRLGLDQSGREAAGCASGPDGAPPCRTCWGTHTL